MKVLVAAALALTTASVNAETLKQRYPSCDPKTQQGLKADVTGMMKDPRQVRVVMRANVLKADLGNARKARRLTQAETDGLYKRVAAVKAGADRYTKQQGFLSAGEAASYERELDAVAARVCRP